MCLKDLCKCVSAVSWLPGRWWEPRGHHAEQEPCTLSRFSSLAASSWAWQGLLRIKLDKETPAYAPSAHQRPGAGWQTPGLAVQSQGRCPGVLMVAKAALYLHTRLHGAVCVEAVQGGDGVSWAQRGLPMLPTRSLGAVRPGLETQTYPCPQCRGANCQGSHSGYQGPQAQGSLRRRNGARGRTRLRRGRGRTGEAGTLPQQCPDSALGWGREGLSSHHGHRGARWGSGAWLLSTLPPLPPPLGFWSPGRPHGHLVPPATFPHSLSQLTVSSSLFLLPQAPAPRGMVGWPRGFFCY